MNMQLISLGMMKSNIKRFWPLWLWFFICWALGLLLPLGIITPMGGSGDFLSSIWKAEYFAAVFGAMLGSIVTCIFIFEYLFKSSSAMFYGSVPVKRKTIFASIYLSGLLPLLIIELIVYVCAFLITQDAHGASTWLGLTLSTTFIFYSLASLCSQLTGNRVVAVILFFACNFLIVCAEFLVRIIADSMLYGLTFDPSSIVLEWLSPGVAIFIRCLHIAEGVTYISWLPLAIYCAVAVVFVMLAALLNNKRNLESATNAASFTFLNPIFKYLFALCLALFFAMIAYVVFAFSGNYISAGSTVILCISMIVGASLGLMFAQMAISKTTRVFHECWKGSIAFAIICIAFVSGCAFDVCGIAKYVPENADVDYAIITVDDATAKIEDESNVQDLLDTHQELVDVGYIDEQDYANTDDYYCSSYSLVIKYKLVDESVVERIYDIPYAATKNGEPASSAFNDFLNILNSKEGITSRFAKYIGEESANGTFDYCLTYYDEDAEDYNDLHLKSSEFDDFIQNALKPDLLNAGAGDYDPLYYRGESDIDEDCPSLCCTINYADDTCEDETLTLTTKNTPNIIKWFEENYDIDMKVS